MPGQRICEPLVFKKSWSTSGSKACWVTICWPVPQNQHIGSGGLGFPTQIVIISPWLSNSPGPQNQHPRSARLNFPTRIRIRGHAQQWWNQKQVSPRWKSLEDSSSQFRHGSGSVVTPQVTSRSNSSSRDVSFEKSDRKCDQGSGSGEEHLEESSGQFRRGLPCF